MMRPTVVLSSKHSDEVVRAVSLCPEVGAVYRIQTDWSVGAVRGPKRTALEQITGPAMVWSGVPRSALRTELARRGAELSPADVFATKTPRWSHLGSLQELLPAIREAAGQIEALQRADRRAAEAKRQAVVVADKRLRAQARANFVSRPKPIFVPRSLR